jgi:paired amphipathic helix protein Sin3a
MSTPDDQAFFERVKAALDNRITYDEFLKLLNLFSQDIIDMKTLVEKSQLFLGEGTELSMLFQRMIGWEERERLVREPDDTNALASNGGGMTGGGGLRNDAIYVRENTGGKEELHHKCGPSYRRIPANEAHIACSGRDELCRSVLNDEWVSHPTWASEDNSGYQSHKKNQYEEALHKCEEERHEFDFHLEIMSKTITALENINMKITQMSTDEKGTFKLKPGLGLPNKSIYQRIIKKVYGKDAGMEVIATLHDCPAVAVPIVLARLKTKDEDWRKAQREWNKVWREVDARNFYKSLDHLGVTFKSTDKKAMTTKALVGTIEAARDEQISQRMALVDSSLARTRPSHQLAYEVHDKDVMKDAVKLILAYLDRLGAMYTAVEREKIERWLLDFLVLFFCLDKADFEEGLKGNPHADGKGALGVSGMVPVDAGGLSMELDPEDIEPTPSGAASGRRTPTKGKGRSTAVNSQDLRKSLLSKATTTASRSHSAKNSPAATPAELPTPAVPASSSAMDTEVKEEGMAIDHVWIGTAPDPAETATSNLRASSNANGKVAGPAADRKSTFFGNTVTYVILRIFQVGFSIRLRSSLTNYDRRRCIRGCCS